VIVGQPWVVYNRGNDINRKIFYKYSSSKKNGLEISDQRWGNRNEVIINNWRKKILFCLKFIIIIKQK
jgi:hypothetical protein